MHLRPAVLLTLRALAGSGGLWRALAGSGGLQRSATAPGKQPSRQDPARRLPAAAPAGQEWWASSRQVPHEADWTITALLMLLGSPYMKLSMKTASCRVHGGKANLRLSHYRACLSHLSNCSAEHLGRGPKTRTERTSLSRDQKRLS